jgi:phosphatidylinositol-3-phosphatase
LKAALFAAAVLAVFGGARAAAFPRFDHIVLVMEENRGPDQVIGTADAPFLTGLAAHFGLAARYYGVTHPSAGNYVALAGGDDWGIHDDGPYTGHTIDADSLTQQLDRAKLSWRAYFQSIPAAGFTGRCYPDSCLYASKHNGIIYFRAVQTSAAALAKMVPIDALDADLRGTPPNFMFVVPDQCHDMHGGHGNCAGEDRTALVRAGDTYAADLAHRIMAAPWWNTGRNALLFVWDEGTHGNNDGCCGAVPGGGHAIAIVVTNAGPRGLRDETPANHYALLRTVEDAFGLPCLRRACDAAPMAALLVGPKAK